MLTGGVSLDKENIAGWFKAGVSAIGMGSKLISNQLLKEKNYAKIEELTKRGDKYSEGNEIMSCSRCVYRLCICIMMPF
jgi:2-keto-3-deoxy-6-phosphogluconate aldolase